MVMSSLTIIWNQSLECKFSSTTSDIRYNQNIPVTTPSCSRPLPATSIGFSHGRSNWLLVTHRPLMAVTSSLGTHMGTHNVCAQTKDSIQCSGRTHINLQGAYPITLLRCDGAPKITKLIHPGCTITLLKCSVKVQSMILFSVQYETLVQIKQVLDSIKRFQRHSWQDNRLERLCFALWMAWRFL